MPPVEIGRAILKTALARATAGTEGARLVGAQLSGVAGTTVQAVLEGLKTLVDGKVDGTDGRLSDARTPKDASVTNAKVDAAAAIAESKLALASDAAVNVASRRTLGTGATQALPGNHTSTTNTRTPTDGSVTRAKMSQDNRGTIICTSTTRPTGTDAPEGQHIYETDTDATLKNTGTPAAPTWSALGGGGTGGDMLILSQPQVSITGAATLDSSAFGKLHILSGAASYSVVLPPVSGNAGKIIAFRVARGYGFWVTLDGNATEFIDGVETRSMWELETAFLLCTGVEWTKIDGKSRPMGCTMRNASADPVLGTNMINGAVTKVELNQADEDFGKLADTANQRIIIRRAGVYRLTFLNYYLNGAGARFTVGVHKNHGTDFTASQIISTEANAYSPGSYPSPSASGRRPFQAGDLVIQSGYQDSGANRRLYAHTTGGASYLTVEEAQPW